MKEFADDPGARVAALWDFGNLCALSPYPDFELAMQSYKSAIQIAAAIPQAAETLRVMLAVCGGVISYCLGNRERGRKLLKRVGHLPVARKNLERMDEIERAGASPTAIQFSLPQVSHEVVTRSRMTCGLRLTDSGRLVKTDPHEQAPWDVYIGPNGIPVSDSEKACAAARKPRSAATSDEAALSDKALAAALEAVPVEKDADPLHVLMFMYGWRDSGGGTVLPRQIAKVLARSGHRVSVIAAASKELPDKPPYYVEETDDGGIRVFQIFNRPALFFDWENPEREVDDPRIRRVIMEIVERLKPDVVHYHSLLNFSMRLTEDIARAGLPSLFSSHNYWPICPRMYLLPDNLVVCSGPSDDGSKCAECVHRPDKSGAYAHRRKQSEHAFNFYIDRHLAPAERMRELYVAAGHNAERSRVVHQCPISVNAIWNALGARREPEKRLERALRVGFLGAVTPLKGVHVLAHAAQGFRKSQLECHIFGSGPAEYVDQLKSIDRKGLLRFRGPYAPDSLPEILSGMDVLVAPTLSEEPGQLAVKEALAARVPVIASRIGGFGDYVGDGLTGCFFETGNAAELAEILARFAKEPELLGELQSNIEPPKRFETYVSEITAQYREVIAGHQPVSSDAPHIEPYRTPEKSVAPGIQPKPHPAATIVWEGSQFVHHSLAFINRELCLRLIDAGHEVSILPYEKDQFGAEADKRFAKIEQRVNATLHRAPDVHVRHQWPPNLTPPQAGRWVMIQPWEFGSVPEEWVNAMRRDLDELWVPSNFVRNSYIRSGLPADRVFVIPNGVDVEKFRPDAPPLKLDTAKRFKFLFVGGTIGRKGPDILINAYLRAFKPEDDVCLVIKDMGGNGVYKGQTAADAIRKLQADPRAPEILYLTEDMSPEDLPGLYTACDCLVHPYRGEGFGMPISEAMACGLPVIVTAAGACLDFCDERSAWLIPAVKKPLKEKRLDQWTTPDYPFLYEPDTEATARLMRRAYTHPQEARAKGARGRERIRAGFTWDHAAELVQQRIDALRKRPPRRMTSEIVALVPGPADSDQLRTCLSALRRYTREAHKPTVQVLGNAAHLPPVDLRVQAVPDIAPAAAVAEAVKGPARYVLLLSPDVIVTKNWLEAMIRAAQPDDVAAVGPTSNHAPEEQRVDAQYTSLKKELRKFAAKRAHHYKDVTQDVERLGAFCVLLKSRAVSLAGGVRPDLPLEEALEELWRRLRADGYRTLCARGVFVHNGALRAAHDTAEAAREDAPTEPAVRR